MEAVTIHEMLINSTDLIKILCNFGVGNISDCEREKASEPPDFNEAVRITLYVIIFLLSVVGNGLIITVLLRNPCMRTVTNLFLLSLALSDLMVSVVCLPFTIIPNIMKDFIFGTGMCKMVMYFMGVSVSVSTFNLVAISLERYNAICNPLASRVWQTKSHAAKVITATWMVCLILMLPYPIFSTLKPFTRHNNSTGHMCRLVWPNDIFHKSWYVSLLLILFMIPGIIMMTAYGLISLELYKGIKYEESTRRASRERQTRTGSIKPEDSDGCYLQASKKKSLQLKTSSPVEAGSKPAVGRVCGSNNSRKQLKSKKRVVRMLMVIVFLFFLCWTPLYVVNTCKAFYQHSANRLTGAPISFIHLLSYISACVNPIIYCFMNKRFRTRMIATFACCGCFKMNYQSSVSSVRSTRSIIMSKGETGKPSAKAKSHQHNGHTSPSATITRVSSLSRSQE
uniref:Gastrin/cholecystokinin type B receptor n=1 Tax=Fundulus heteroclitus TaxID=8078 RepID=A0A3Q2PQB0_FUNHE